MSACRRAVASTARSSRRPANDASIRAAARAAVGLLQRGEDLLVLGNGAFRRMRAAIAPTGSAQQRELRPRRYSVPAARCRSSAPSLQVELAGQADGFRPSRPSCGPRSQRDDVVAQFIAPARARGGRRSSLHHQPFQAAAHLEGTSPCLVDRRIRRPTAPRLGLTSTSPSMARRPKSFAHQRAADAEAFADRVLRQLGAGTQGLLDDRPAQGAIDRQGALPGLLRLALELVAGNAPGGFRLGSLHVSIASPWPASCLAPNQSAIARRTGLVKLDRIQYHRSSAYKTAEL
jgi:hypothetical protein